MPGAPLSLYLCTRAENLRIEVVYPLAQLKRLPEQGTSAITEITEQVMSTKHIGAAPVTPPVVLQVGDARQLVEVYRCRHGVKERPPKTSRNASSFLE